MNTYKPNEFAEMIGVSVKTLQRWDKDNKLKAFRNPSNRRYYTHNQYVQYINNKFNKNNIVSFCYNTQGQRNKLVDYAVSIGCKEVN